MRKECTNNEYEKGTSSLEYFTEKTLCSRIYPEAEAIYDFIKSLCVKAGSITYKGVEVSQMKIFFNLWNEYNSETFRILDHLVNDIENDKEEPLNSMTCFDGDVMIVVPVEEE